MAMLWVIFVALGGLHLGHGLPLKSTPQVYPQDGSGGAGAGGLEAWGWESAWYWALPAMALVAGGAALLLGCTWCYSHKDCKQPNEGAENQLFTASATHVQDGRRAQQPDSGFPEPVGVATNNNISEDNNNGPISLREMQNIANNNAAAYIVSENEERNRNRESVVEFEPLPAPAAIGVADPLESCADWFEIEDFPRERLQYIREFARGWFGRVVETEMDNDGSTSIVAVKILDPSARAEDKARFVREARVFRDARHGNVLACRAHCLRHEPWILIFDMYHMDLREYLEQNQRLLDTAEGALTALRLMCDVAAGLDHLHARGHCADIRPVCSANVLVKETAEGARAVLGSYVAPPPRADPAPPETNDTPPQYTASSSVWELGTLLWEVSGGRGAPSPPPPPPTTPLAHHLYQVIQLCWQPEPGGRPTAAQVLALLTHLRAHAAHPAHPAAADGDFEERWQRLKPNTIPKCDEHVALVHAPSTSAAGGDALSPAPPPGLVSRSSSVISDRDLSAQYRSESLTNLHGSLDDVRNIYLTHDEAAAIECHQGNIAFAERDRDSALDPWLKDIISDSQDDASYYRDVSDVIKSLDNILNSEKTSSSESSHHASPSRDNLSLDCRTDHPVQSCMVKSPGITNFQNILEMGFDAPPERTPCDDDDVDRDTIGTLSHSFGRHSDTASLHTLENLSPDTPVRDSDIVTKVDTHTEPEQKDLEARVGNETLESPKRDMPNENNVDCSDRVPTLKEICTVVANTSISEPNRMNAIEDCETSCDSKVIENARTDNETETKSLDNMTCDVTEEATRVTPTKEKENQKHEVVDSNCKHSLEYVSPAVNNVLPDLINDTLEFKHLEIPSSPVNEDVTVISKLIDVIEPVNISENDKTHFEALPTVHDSSSVIVASLNLIEHEKAVPYYPENKTQGDNVFIDSLENGENIINEKDSSQLMERPEICAVSEKVSSIPELVQKNTESVPDACVEDVNEAGKKLPLSTPEEVQNSDRREITAVVNNSVHALKDTKVDLSFNDEDERLIECEISDIRSESNKETERSSESTVYMDLNNTNSCKIVNKPLDDNVKKVVDSCLEKSNSVGECTIVNNESTVYLDLPSVINITDNFLQAEKVNSIQRFDIGDQIFSSTPKMSDSSENTTLENSAKGGEAFSETKVPSDDSGGPFNKFEQQQLSDVSPFESPTKSHPTDTYTDSVVLGPFENCSLELFKGGKCDLADLPKEELLAFSSNFSEINLETPSPLRDVNFLNEVPDVHFDDISNISTSEERKIESKEQTENTDDSQPGTAKRLSPSTPPNSPGIFLASTSQEKYLVNIDLDTPTESVQSYAPVETYPPIDCDSGLSSLQKEVDLNQIELTTKMAMAENENNMNIEYLGPLTVEGLVSEDDVVANSDALPEIFLASGGALEGNGAMDEWAVVMDEDCMKALRNELELKLPLAQVAAIEPAVENEAESDQRWESLPPPPELVLQYGPGAGAPPAALSPIQEETHHQLTAYENDAWTVCPRSESSESYPEPCNNSTDSVTELPAAPSDPAEPETYTLKSANDTYTLQKDIMSSTNELTMSADSLNGSPYKGKPVDVLSPIVDDRTYNKDDEKESHCERLSQVSPCIVSPTTEATAPTENVDNATGASTLSKTTLPTDAKHSKPSECLSKATSIDSWCSNDTLYNVEENFDDLIMDPEEHDNREKDDSESTDTLTHRDYERDASHCSTYIIHDSKSEICDTFSPDSINANDNNTYTKAKTVTGTTDEKDSTKNTQTKDLAYETLPSYSNCTTELMSGVEDQWKLPHPEMVRRSSLPGEVHVTPPRFFEEKKQISVEEPQTEEPTVKKMDSVEITCLQDNMEENETITKNSDNKEFLYDSPKYNSEMTPSVTSTPLLEQAETEHTNKLQSIPLQLASPEANDTSKTTFESFQQSAELRPQDSGSRITSEATSSNLDLAKTSNDFNKLQSPSSDMAPSDTSTPVLELADTEYANKLQNIPLQLASPEANDSCEPNFESFQQSAELRPQDSGSRITNEATSSNSDLAKTSNDFNKLHSESSDMAPSDTSTPVLEVADIEYANKLQPIPLHLTSSVANNTSETNFEAFQQSAGLRPQNSDSEKASAIISSNSDLAGTRNDFNKLLLEQTPNYIDFQDSASRKPQEVSSMENSSQNEDGSVNSGDYRQFESSARNLPQDLSSIINASSLLIHSERQVSENILSAVSQNVRVEPTNEQTKNPCQSQPEKAEGEQTPKTSAFNTNLTESQSVPVTNLGNICVTDYEDENEQPHSIIMTEFPLDHSLSPVRTFDSHTAQPNVTATAARDITTVTSPNKTFDSHSDFQISYNSHAEGDILTTKENRLSTQTPHVNGVNDVDEMLVAEVEMSDSVSSLTNGNTESLKNDSSSLIFDISGVSGVKSSPLQVTDLPNGSASEEMSTSTRNTMTEVKCNGNSENHAVNLMRNDLYKDLMERNDDRSKDSNFEKSKLGKDSSHSLTEALKSPVQENQLVATEEQRDASDAQKVNGSVEGRIASVTDDFLQNEKNFCQLDSYLPLLNDIRFTGPASEIMSTSFTEQSPTEPEAPECEQDVKPNALADLMKDWDSDSDSHSSNSSSGEFIWKDGAGHETAIAPNTHFQHQRGSGGGTPGSGGNASTHGAAGEGSGASGSGSSGSGSGSEGDEVEFVPSSWDCRAEPAKSSLRSLENAAAVTPDNKKRVMFKRQKYHCVYEYPREPADAAHSPAYLPDLSTYCEWDPTSAEEAELGYGQLFGPPLDLLPLRAHGLAYGPDFDDDFFISSSTRPFESLGLMSSASQFFPGLRGKYSAAPRPPPHLPATPTLPGTPTTDLDFTTPDSGVEDITPGSTGTDEDFKKVPESEVPWRPSESGSSSESASPSSPGGGGGGGGELGGLRHTRDRLKLELPPSPHLPSPRAARVFSFTLDTPKRARSADLAEPAPDQPPDQPPQPLILTDDTPLLTAPLSLPDDDEVDLRAPEPTFSTFGKVASKTDDAEHKIILTDDAETPAPVQADSPVSKEEVMAPAPVKETVKEEVTSVDSADEDSGIESSAAGRLSAAPPPAPHCPR